MRLGLIHCKGVPVESCAHAVQTFCKYSIVFLASPEALITSEEEAELRDARRPSAFCGVETFGHHEVDGSRSSGVFAGCRWRWIYESVCLKIHNAEEEALRFSLFALPLESEAIWRCEPFEEDGG